MFVNVHLEKTALQSHAFATDHGSRITHYDTPSPFSQIPAYSRLFSVVLGRFGLC